MFATGISNDGDVVSAQILSPRPYPTIAVNVAREQQVTLWVNLVLHCVDEGWAVA
jgi:hypothetical protein